MGATRKDIAKAAGVSLSTAGMILGGSGALYKAETRRRVLETATRMGYQPSVNAKALRLRRSFLLGVLFNEVNSFHASQFLRGVQQALDPTEYSPLVFFTHSEADQESSLNHCLSRQIDALLVNCVVDPVNSRISQFDARVAGLGIPVMEFFGSHLSGVPRIDVDSRHSGRLGVEHFIGLGHRRIAMFTHSHYLDSQLHEDACQMADGYQLAMKEAGLRPCIFSPDFDYTTVAPVDFVNSGESCFNWLAEQNSPPTAVLCYSDFMAYGLMRTCQTHGVKVPADLSVIGNTDLLFSTVVNPPLSTLGFDSHQVGFQGVDRLIKSFSGLPIESVGIQPHLVLRQSTGPPPVR